MPVYSLLGDRARTGIALYRHADGNSIEAVEDRIRQFMDQGFRYVRVHMGTYGGNFDGSIQKMVHPEGAPGGAYYSSRTYMQSVIRLFERVRSDIGWNLEIMHDIHERLSLADTLAFTKEMAQFKPFFIEDALAPDQVQYFRYLREQTDAPLAMGELFTNPLEWRTVVQNQWIDFIRCHLSDIGGITPARKLAAFCEAYQVRTAWHGPNDLSPVGMVAQMHLDLNCPNFGIQEWAGFNEAEEEVFPGCPVVKDGYAYLSSRPGLGIDFDEAAAAHYPAVDLDFSWLFSRLEDGTAVRP